MDERSSAQKMDKKEKLPKLILAILLYLLSVSYVLSYFDIAFNYPILSYLKWILLTFNVIFLLLLVKDKSKIFTNMNLSIGSFILIFPLLNIFLSVNKTTSLATLGIIILSFTFFILLSKVVCSGIISMFEINKIIYTSIFIIVLISTIVTIQEYFSFMDVLTSSGRFRIKGLFRHPNSLAMNCVLGIIVLFDNLIKTKIEKKKRSLINYFVFFFLIFNVIASDSNTALYTLFTFAIIYSYLYKMRDYIHPLRALQLYFLIILTIVGVYVMLNFLSDTGLGDRTNSVSVRLDTWVIVFNYMVVEPVRLLFGYGLSGTGQYSSGSFQELGLAVDNGFVTFLFQTGLIGLVILITYIIPMLIKIVFKHSVNSEKHFKVFVFSSVFCLLLYSMFENILIAMGNFITLYIWFRIYNFKYINKKQSQHIN